MADLRPVTCCFSGYRIEKMPFRNEDCPAARELFAALDAAVAEAAADGCTRFLSGMSTGFDLWAAEAVLRARAALPVQLLCAVPFDGQADRFPLEWKRRFNRCLLAADKVYALSRSYHAGCFAARNRFMVDASSRLICYYDGRSGGTAQTVRMAEQSGLKIVNLADGQLSLLKRTDRDGQSFCFGLARAEWKIENGEWRMDVMVWFSEPSCYGARYSSSPI